MQPFRPPDDPAVQRSQQDGSLLEDERAIEGLPIRLVIALVVGVAALAIMMSLLDGVGSVGQTEVDVEIDSDSEVIYTDDVNSGEVEVTMDVVSEDGEPVEDGRVMVQAGSAQLDTPQTAELDGDNTVTFTFDNTDSSDGNDVELRADQNQGTLEVEIFPPSDSDYTDSLRNSEIIVIEGSDAGS